MCPVLNSLEVLMTSELNLARNTAHGGPILLIIGDRITLQMLPCCSEMKAAWVEQP